MESYQWQNQLQFNLTVPSISNNLAVRYHRPTPIVIDRAGGPSGAHIQQEYVQISQNVSTGMNFSNVSEDRLTAAVKLAQRDMKKKKEEEFLKNFVKSQKTRSRSPSPKSARLRKIPGQDMWLRQRRRQPVTGNKPALKVKEHDRNRVTRSARTQTPPRKPGPLERRVPDHTLPVTTNSPPSRDTDIKVYPVQKSAPCDQPAKEIERLQREMESYLQQIQVIEQRAMQDQGTQFLKPSIKAKAKEGYLEREEGNDRKQARSEELATRATRQLYMLKQQIREIQNEVIRGGPQKIKHTKKSRTYAKLAAAHRGVVRAIQSFVTNLPHTDLSRGLPSTYHELSFLIRQMTLVSNQVSVEDKSSVQEDLIHMLDRVDDLNKAWCQDKPEIEDTVTQKPVIKPKQRQISPASRPMFVMEAPNWGRQLQVRQGKENKPKGIMKTSTAGSRGAIRKPKQVKVETSPERKSALRAGIAALVETGELRRSKSGMAWDLSSESHAAAAPRSLILPAKLQEKRVRAQQAVVKSIPDCHFADPTVSSNLKAMTPQKNLVLEERERSFSAPPSPVSSHRRDPSRSPDRLGRMAWRPGGTPGKTPTPRGRRRTRSQSPTLTRQCLIQDMLDADVAKTLFSEEDERGRRHGRSKSPVRSRSMSPTDRLVTRAELAIQRRLQPLLDQAEAIAGRHESSEDATRKVNTRKESIEERGDHLTEMILDDVIRDTADGFNRMEEDESARRKAVSMQDSPTLENLLQRLEEMEMEQFDIRKRWQTLEFAETEPVRRSKGVVVTRPLAPAAMEITRHTVPPKSLQRNLGTNKDNDPIIFTKMKSVPVWKENRTYEDSEWHGILSESAYTSHKPTERQVTLPDSVVQKIQSGVESYNAYLKKISHHKTGKFDPWRLMEEVADHVLMQCVQEIASELEDLNEDIVNQVCKSEFTIPKSVASSPGQALSGSSTPGPFPGDSNSPEIVQSGANSPRSIHAEISSPGQGQSPIHIRRTDSPKIVMFSEQPMQFSVDDEERSEVREVNSVKDESDGDYEEDDDDDDDDVDDDDDEDYSYEDDYEDDDATKSA